MTYNTSNFCVHVVDKKALNIMDSPSIFPNKVNNILHIENNTYNI